MSAPAFVDVAKGTAVKVATAVSTGQIHLVKPGAPGAEYLATYVPTGDDAPDNIDDFRGGRIFNNGNTAAISSSELIDVYLWLTGDEDGRVRVDI